MWLLKVVPCANDTLAPPFSPGHYLYTAHEADPFTGEVAIKTACTGGCHSVSVLVDGKTVDAAHVPLNNATDGPGPDKGTLIEVNVQSAQGTETYKVTVTRPLKPPLLWTLVPDAGLLSPPFSPRSDFNSILIRCLIRFNRVNSTYL